MTTGTKATLIFIAIYFIALYLIAWFANRKHREEDDILGIGRLQWRAILIMWIPSLILLVKG